MEKYGFTELTEDAVSYAAFWANKRRMEFITPELVLVGVTVQMRFAALARMAMFDEKALRKELQEYNDKIDVIPEGEDYTLEISLQTHQVFEEAQKSAEFSGHSKINVPHLIRGILMLHGLPQAVRRSLSNADYSVTAEANSDSMPPRSFVSPRCRD